MPGETQLSTLLSSMKPKLQTGRWVFASIRSDRLTEVFNLINLKEMQGFYQEDEGATLILEDSQAKLINVATSEVFSAISLTVHSSLEAVGLTAAISTALANDGISANIIAGYYHDHIYVPEKKATKALNCLNKLSKQ